MNVVWLKRDVRLDDHEPLALAAKSDVPCIVLYVYESELMRSDTYHESHHRFINEGLAELNDKLRTMVEGGGITFRSGEIVKVLSELHASAPLRTIFSHREVGNSISRLRNERVQTWADANGVAWTQCRQDGVSDVRHEELDEGSWAKKWTAQMQSRRHPPPSRLPLVDSRFIERGVLADASSCGVAHLGVRPGAQRGGEAVAQGMLASFLSQRGEGYCDELSSPHHGWVSCSRLSPYLAWGHISLRAVFQALSARQEEVRAAKKGGTETGRWLKSLAALGSRLRWRSHFAQKLHDQPDIETANLCRAYDSMRTEFDAARCKAWADGCTGYPMVDACMRSLRHTGWLNFRMRCMLVSFACYDLWLDWRPLTTILARRFLDYEPGIHYPQFQMQAGTTGINANRIYSAKKQAEDHAGPDFAFIRRWCPELANVPSEYMPEPHRMPADVQRACGCVIGVDYPAPIVDHAASYRHATAEFAKVRAQAQTKLEAAAVYEKHGSRKRPATAGGGAQHAKRSTVSAGSSAGGAPIEDRVVDEAGEDGAAGIRESGASGEAGDVPPAAELESAATAAATAACMPLPFTAETAGSGRASCRQCGEAISKGSRKVSVRAWARGGWISANHHASCFVGGLRLEACPSNRGKCKHCGEKFVKGCPRVGYCTTGKEELGWLCLESARSLIGPMDEALLTKLSHLG